jgi:hypothetical protein
MGSRPAGSAGYSVTPLANKLGVKEGFRSAVIDEPPEFRELLGELPAGVVLNDRIGRSPNIVVLFVTDRGKLLSRSLRRTARAIFPTGAIWVMWPKRSSKVQTDVTEDTVRELGLPMGLVDNKVCAISDVWSGLRVGVAQAASQRWRAAKGQRDSMIY